MYTLYIFMPYNLMVNNTLILPNILFVHRPLLKKLRRRLTQLEWATPLLLSILPSFSSLLLIWPTLSPCTSIPWPGSSTSSSCPSTMLRNPRTWTLAWKISTTTSPTPSTATSADPSLKKTRYAPELLNGEILSVCFILFFIYVYCNFPFKTED